MKNKILLYDVTLRDGSHAIAHQFSKEQFVHYAKLAEIAGIPYIEAGHGNGLGASSLLVGKSLISDETIIKSIKEQLTKTKLSIHDIPGFATINGNLSKAIDYGVDLVRVASHCTEADITERHIGYVRERGKEAYGVLMMSHMADKEILLEEAYKMQSYGAEAIIIMDSAGYYLPRDVSERIHLLSKSLNIPVGFHAHNNLGMSIANSVAAIESGARIIDGSIRGFGAGAGNASIEVLVAVLSKMEIETGIDLYKILDAAEEAEQSIISNVPVIANTSIVSGLAGVFSGFAKHVKRLSKEYSIDPRDLFFELGKKQVVAGQEDIIVETAIELSENVE